MLRIMALLATLVIGPSGNIPFDFAGLNTTSAMTFSSPGLTSCYGTEANGSCKMLLKSFGNVPISSSTVRIVDHHLDGMFITANANDYNLAVAALVAKYGPESSVTSFLKDAGRGPRVTTHTWYFLDGFLVCTIDNDKSVFSLIFGSNKKSSPKIDF